MTTPRPSFVAPSLAALSLLAAACSAPGGPNGVDLPWPGDRRPQIDAGAGPTDAPVPTINALTRCRPARTSSPLPATVTAMSADQPAREVPVFTADLYDQFRSHCGACHVDTKLGDFQVSLQTFATAVDSTTLSYIKADDPARFMPPPAAGGKPYSQRSVNDPIVQLVAVLDRWIAAGRPREAFFLPSPQKADLGRYQLSIDEGTALTNLGNCVPEPDAVATSLTDMQDRDAFFAAATELPESLVETDLVTLEAAELAARGVVAYAPGYPLWTDDAGKLRHVRVPRGLAIRFDKPSQRFEIPANTRFYKTFLRAVIDRDGRPSWRKIETRLIVSRPDRMRDDGVAETTSLFGTYVWNDDETEAHLLRDPLRNGKPFRDRMITIIVDEPRAQKIRDAKPPNLTYALEVENRGVVRRYAVPGSERCIQCHQGSAGADFVLGFTPLQIHRRPEGQGGVIEPTGPDELDQLDRLIRYGVITGMTGAGDVLPLERTQGARTPRNEQELTAQGYVLGNCAHCHNPAGFPSVKNPDLRDLLDFLPSPTGGIFQFPLERYSPRLKRGLNQDVLIPYITPSLREHPVGPLAGYSDGAWKPKHFVCIDNPDFCAPNNGGVEHVDAPWRSLIYRNVDAPFPYADDYAIFPHMPMNSPGFDCRAPRLLGEWMVSIPAVRKSELDNADLVYDSSVVREVDREPQPYVEVTPEDPRYGSAANGAMRRLGDYQMGRRYRWCPSTEDIVDRDVLSAQSAGRAGDAVPRDKQIREPDDKARGWFLPDNIPDHAHWVVTDLTDAAGDWYPRRPDWQDVLVKGRPDPTLTPTELQRWQGVLAGLRDARITAELKSFVLGQVPFGLWKFKPECDFSAVPRAGSLTGPDKPTWLDVAKPASDAPVYLQSPGSAVFGMICINCHGPQADSRGIQADAVSLMTGGETRVANLREGLFGPSAQPGANRTRVFGPSVSDGLTTDDWAARYMAWMALGGTRRAIPSSILAVVGTTPVVGQQRFQLASDQGSPNMLQKAVTLCLGTLPFAAGASAVPLSYLTGPNGAVRYDRRTQLIADNGDADMWQRLCMMGNRPIVRVPAVRMWSEEATLDRVLLSPRESFFWADAYPADAPVLSHRGQVVLGVKADNLAPLCFRKPSALAEREIASAFIRRHYPLVGQGPLPFCPEALFEGPAESPRWRLASTVDEENVAHFPDLERWGARGAINAGFAVYLHLEALARGAASAPPRFDQCEQLPP